MKGIQWLLNKVFHTNTVTNDLRETIGTMVDHLSKAMARLFWKIVVFDFKLLYTDLQKGPVY